MYCGKNGSKGSYYWWLASPSAGDSGRMCAVDGNYARFGTNGYTSIERYLSASFSKIRL